MRFTWVIVADLVSLTILDTVGTEINPIKHDKCEGAVVLRLV